MRKKMRISSLLVGLSIASLATATALPALNEAECDYLRYEPFNTTTDVDTYVRCAETDYKCGLYDLNSTVPAGCEKKKYVLFTAGNFTGPLALPGLTELWGISIRDDYGRYGESGVARGEPPTKVTTIDLPDLVNITVQSFIIEHADSISSLNVPKLRNIGGELNLNFAGGPALNLSFPSLVDVSFGDIYIEGEIDDLDFPVLKTISSITVRSTGNLDCDAFGENFQDTHGPVLNGNNSTADLLRSRTWVRCSSKNGSYTTGQSNGTGLSSRAHRGLLALTALLAYMLAL